MQMVYAQTFDSITAVLTRPQPAISIILDIRYVFYRYVRADMQTIRQDFLDE